MASIRKALIVDIMRAKKKDYSETIPKALEMYVRKQYKCSPYLAKQVVQDLIQNQNETRLL
jgi:hypothetical protein